MHIRSLRHTHTHTHMHIHAHTLTYTHTHTLSLSLTLISLSLQQVMWLKTSADLMRTIRRKQLAKQARQQRETAAEVTGNADKEQTSEDPDSSQPSLRSRKTE